MRVHNWELPFSLEHQELLSIEVTLRGRPKARTWFIKVKGPEVYEKGHSRQRQDHV